MTNETDSNQGELAVQTAAVQPAGRSVEASAQPAITVAAKQPGSFATKLKDGLASAQSLFTTAAIIAAGIWFLLQGQNHPKLKIEQHVSQRQLVNTPGQVLLGVDVSLSNVGNVALQLDCGHLTILDVNPGKHMTSVTEETADANTELIWPALPKNVCLGSMRIEPGEGDQVHREIPIRGSTRTVRVQSFFKNPKAAVEGDGWEAITLYDIDQNLATANPVATVRPR